MNIVKELAEEWHRSGLEYGDMVLIHSNIRRTLIKYWEKDRTITPVTMLESFIEAVGTEGTLLFPLFNFDFADGIAFDYRHTKSQMGALTEAARLHPKAIRTKHPFYSFAVIGAKSPLFANVDNFSGYGDDSPFGILRKLGGKIAALDLTEQEAMTFYHHIEEMNQVPYRYHKKFSGEYIDEKGHCAIKSYGIYVRNLEAGVVTDLNPAGEIIWKAGLYNGFRPGIETGLRVIVAQKMFDYVSELVNTGKLKLYKIEKGQ